MDCDYHKSSYNPVTNPLRMPLGRVGLPNKGRNLDEDNLWKCSSVSKTNLRSSIANEMFFWYKCILFFRCPNGMIFSFRPCNIAHCDMQCSEIIAICNQKVKNVYHQFLVKRGESRRDAALKKFMTCVEEHSSSCFRYGYNSMVTLFYLKGTIFIFLFFTKSKKKYFLESAK